MKTLPAYNLVMIEFGENVVFAEDLTVFVKLGFKPVGYAGIFSKPLDYGERCMET